MDAGHGASIGSIPYSSNGGTAGVFANANGSGGATASGGATGVAMPGTLSSDARRSRPLAPFGLRFRCSNTRVCSAPVLAQASPSTGLDGRASPQGSGDAGVAETGGSTASAGGVANPFGTVSGVVKLRDGGTIHLDPSSRRFPDRNTSSATWATSPRRFRVVVWRISSAAPRCGHGPMGGGTEMWRGGRSRAPKATRQGTVSRPQMRRGGPCGAASSIQRGGRDSNPRPPA